MRTATRPLLLPSAAASSAGRDRVRTEAAQSRTQSMTSSTLLVPLLIGGATVALIVLAQVVARRIPLLAKATRMNDVVGFYLGIVGVLYAVALTFVMIAAWENQGRARELVDKETVTLGTIGLLARGLPPSDAERLIGYVKAYAQTALGDERRELAQGHVSQRLDLAGSRIWLLVLTRRPKDLRDQILVDHLTTACTDLKATRRARRLTAGYRIPSAIWALMVYGGLATVALCFLFEVDERGLHHAKTALLAAFIVMSLLVTWDFQEPFRGISNVSFEPFEALLRSEPTLNEDVWIPLREEFDREVPKDATSASIVLAAR